MYERIDLGFDTINISIQNLAVLLHKLLSLYERTPVVNKAPLKYPNFLRVQDVADKYSVTPRTVWRWIKKKYIEPTYVGGSTLFDEVLLLAHVLANKANKKIR